MRDGDPRAARLIGGALQSAERARTLVSACSASRGGSRWRRAPVDVAALVDGMRDLIASSVGPPIELAILVDDDLPPAMADPNQLELALLNLCVNARDAMPDGGTLTIAADACGDAAGERRQAWRRATMCGCR